MVVKTRIIPTKFKSEGEWLRGNFVIPRGSGPFPGICKFHGLPGSSNQIGGIAARLAEAGFAVLTFDFRGFRFSNGQFTLAGEVEDARNAITHLLNSKNVREGWAGVYGASYGGAVAVLAAARDQRISAICIRAPVYDTLAFARSSLVPAGIEELLQIAPNEMHGLRDPKKRQEILDRMIQDAMALNPINEISKIASRPLFIITGDADKGIDLPGVVRLFEVAHEPKEMLIVAGADHNLSDPMAYETTIGAIVAWFLRQINEPT